MGENKHECAVLLDMTGHRLTSAEIHERAVREAVYVEIEIEGPIPIREEFDGEMALEDVLWTDDRHDLVEDVLAEAPSTRLCIGRIK